MPNNLLKKFSEYDKDKPRAVKEISGLLGIPINGNLAVEVPNRNGFVYVRLRNNTNELIQAFNEKVSPVYGLPVLVVWKTNRYEVQGRDTTRYQDWGSYSAFLPRHGSQHSLNFEDGQGGDVSFIYSRQFTPFATIPSGTDGAGTVFVMPHVYRAPDASWNYIGDKSSPNFLPAKPTGTSARMMLLVWDLSSSDSLIITGTFLSESLTGTSSVLSAVPTVTNQNYVPLAAIRLVSGTQTILWDNIYDMRQYAVTTPPAFGGGFSIWDEGVPIGTGTTLNFVGNNVEASISGSVVRVFVTGSTGGGGTTFSGVDQIGISGFDEGSAIGTGTQMNFVGAGVTASRTGTMIFVEIPGAGAGGSANGIMGWDEGVPKGTGTILNVVGSGGTLSISGTVLNLDISGGGASTSTGTYFLIRKSTDTFRNNQIATDDPDLKFTAPANTVWGFDLYLIMQSYTQAADVNLGFSIPTGSNLLWGGLGGQPNSFTAQTISASQPLLLASGTQVNAYGSASQSVFSTRWGMGFHGIFDSGVNGGNIAVSWADNAASSGVWMFTNSYMAMSRLV